MQELVLAELLCEPLSGRGGEVQLEEPLVQDRIAVKRFQIAEQRVGDQPLLLAALPGRSQGVCDLVAPGEGVAFIAAGPCCLDERDPGFVERMGMRSQHAVCLPGGVVVALGFQAAFAA
jgi:hypothetical protein